MPCDINPSVCNNNGECSNDNNGGYACTCRNGYLGVNCEIGMEILNYLKWNCSV